jgi:hypothetical protein
MAIRFAPIASRPRSSAPALDTTGTSRPSPSSTPVIWASAWQWWPGPCAMIATRQAEATTSGRASASSSEARSVCAFIRASSSGVTCFIRIRLEWKVNRSSGSTCSRSRIIRGSSVSIVRFELGTIMPMRWSLTGASEGCRRALADGGVHGSCGPVRGTRPNPGPPTGGGPGAARGQGAAPGRSGRHGADAGDVPRRWYTGRPRCRAMATSWSTPTCSPARRSSARRHRSPSSRWPRSPGS